MSNPTTDSSATDEVELALRLMDSDESVLGEILTHCGSSILRILVAKYSSFNHQDAEDVLSIAVNKLWDKRADYDESKGTLRNYFYKIADHTAKDVFKRGWAKAKALPVDFGEDNLVDLIPEETTPEDESKAQRKRREKKEQKEFSDLQEIISQLPDKERQVVLSDAYAKDRVSDAAKLADELGIAVGSVRGYRSRAWKTIRSKMRVLGYELPPEGESHGKG